MRHVQCGALAVWLLILGQVCTAQQQKYSIQGTVINEQGKPVPGAQVRIDPLNGRPRAEGVRVVETDSNGHFLMIDLEAASYKVFAMKESAGYPDTAFSFYSDNRFETVTLTPTISTANLMIRIGPPAGIITGAVRDSVTGKPIHATIILRRTAPPHYWYSLSASSTYKALVPSDADIILEVSAARYNTWFFGGPNDHLNRTPVRLKPNQETTLDVHLEPVKQEKQ